MFSFRSEPQARCPSCAAPAWSVIGPCLLATIMAAPVAEAQLPCPTDADGNGVTDAFDLGQLLGAWGPNPGHPADYNADGIVDPFDLGQLLGAWGPCTQCFVDADCNDGDDCTQDHCLAQVCQSTPLTPCCGDGVVEPPEQCDPPDGTFCSADCQLLQCPGAGDCCEANGTPGCQEQDCCVVVCVMDAFCCEVEWDALCGELAQEVCPVLCPADSDCCIAHGTPGCDNLECESLICGLDPFCCDVSWDTVCADAAIKMCAICAP